MDEQCRWCGNGGNLLCCDFCHNAFCKQCIKRNLGRSELSKVVDAGIDVLCSLVFDFTCISPWVIIDNLSKNPAPAGGPGSDIIY